MPSINDDNESAADLADTDKLANHLADDSITSDSTSSYQSKTNKISSLNADEMDSKYYNDFVCDLIRKQIENENKIKTDISNLNGRVITHIYEKIDRGHVQIFDYKFRDYLLSIGYDKETTNQAINYLQDTYDGSLDLNELKVFYNSFTTTNWNFKNDLHLKKLLNCSLMPGYIDGFSEDNTISSYEQLWQKLYKFLLSHRLPAEAINEPYLENRIIVSNLRRRILVEFEKNFYEENLKNKSVCIDQQCISCIRACCSQEKVSALTDGKSLTYWQTTDTEKCINHSILINLKENIKLTSLSLSSIGNKNDDFLKTVVIEIRAGSANKSETIISKCDYNLTLNNDYLLCSCFPNDQNITYLKIVFKRNSERNYWGRNSDLIKIKSLKIVGKKEITKTSKITVQDASICWYFEMLSAIALMQSQLIPSLHSKILQISKTALQNIPPLSLTLDSKNSFLTPNVLEKVDFFLKSFLDITSASIEDKAEAILIYLSFNLARGNLKAILGSLLLVLENFDLKYNFLDLITKIDESSQISLRKTAEAINLKFFKITTSNNSSNKTTDDSSNEIEIISASNDETSEFSLEPSNNQKKTESIGIKGAVVILIFNKERPNIEQFEQFDSFDQEKFNAYKENLKKNHKDLSNQEYDACYFEFYDNQIDIMLELPIFHIANYVLIKFMRPKENSPKNIIISQIKVLGCKHNSFELYDQIKRMQKYSQQPQGPSASILVNTVLWFLCQLAEQHKNQNKNNEDSVQLLDFEDFEINDLWKIYTKAFEMKKKKDLLISVRMSKLFEDSNSLYSNLKIPVLILLYELVNCIEIRNTLSSKSKSKSSHILESLCEIIDSQEDEQANNQNDLNKILKTITKEIIKNGISVFYDEKEQREFFLSLVEKNSKNSESNCTEENKFSLKKTSTKLLFEAFCNLFCSNKLSIIQHLSKSENNFENYHDQKQILSLLDKLIDLSFSLNNDFKIDKTDEDRLVFALCKLINSIQSNMFFNIREKLIKNAKNSNKDCIFENLFNKNISEFLVDYTKLIIEKNFFLIEKIRSFHSDNKLIENNLFKLKQFYNKIVYNFFLWLSEIFDQLDLNTCTNILTLLVDFHKSIKEFETLLDDEKPLETEKILKIWTFNSKTKSSIFDLAIDYCHPLANRFVIDFDPNSSLVFTENSDFIDSTERVHLFSGKLGSSNWNEKMEIKSNTYIALNIRSNKDLKLTNTFFLKFTITAYGFEQNIDQVVFRDLIESVTSLFGTHLHRAYYERFSLSETLEAIAEPASSNRKLSVERRNSKDESAPNEKQFLLCGFQHQFSVNSSTHNLIGSPANDKNKIINDLDHEFYRILFRGGFNEKFRNYYEESNEDSQSGLTSNLSDNKLLQFLEKLMNYFGCEKQDEKIELQKFMQLYEKNYESYEKIIDTSRTKIGGVNLSELILKLFCALIWQNSSILYQDLFSDESPVFNQQVAQTYKIAESTRMFIVENQQIFKMKHNSNLKENKTLFEILNEKIVYLLKFERTPAALQEYELKKMKKQKDDSDPQSHAQHGQNSSENILFPKKKKTRIPKCESNPIYNLVFEFIFDKNSNNLDSINRVLILKRSNSILISKNFQLAQSHLLNILNSSEEFKFKSNLELVLTFLSNFFSTQSSSQFNSPSNQSKSSNDPLANSQTNSSSGNKNIQSRVSFPASLKSAATHYLQSLYACGLNIEHLVQNSFYNFIKLLLDYSNKLNNQTKVDNILQNLVMRLDCFITYLLDIDWEIFDLKFFHEFNLLNYHLKNTFKSIPICNFKDDRYATPNDLLEDIFTISREKYDEAMDCLKKNPPKSAKIRMPSFCLTSLDEEDEDKLAEDSESKKPQKTDDKDENKSFDLKIFPKLYQSVFQNSNTKQFDTNTLFKCFSTDLKSFEQYEKYIVARYMFWKYFSKLNTNFYCDTCEVILNGYRYVCLDCRDHCLCLNCFSKSIVTEEKNDESNSISDKPLVSIISGTGHKSSHKMLLLDHMCDQCQSLIIGRRIRCEECKDYDLCLMCSKEPEYSPDNPHKKEHKMSVHEPCIMVARPETVQDAQIFLHLHSQFLFSIFTLKLCDFLNNSSPKSNNTDFTYLKELYSYCLNVNMNLICQAGYEEPIKNNVLNLEPDLIPNLKIFSFYNQENIAGLIACILRVNRDIWKEQTISFSSAGSIQSSCKLFNDVLQEPYLENMTKFIFKIISKISDYQYNHLVNLMFIGILKSILVISDPSNVNILAQELLKSNNLENVFEEMSLEENNREYTLELILYWIENFMMVNLSIISSAFFGLLFKLNQSEKWKPRISNFLKMIFDNLLKSIDSFKSQLHSKFYIFLYALNCNQLNISYGEWIDFKSESLYDGAGVLKSTMDSRIGLTKIFYNESVNTGYFVCIIDPESRKMSTSKSQKFDDNDFKKATEKSRIKVKNSFDLDDVHLFKIIEILKELFKLKDLDKNNEIKIDSSVTNKQLMIAYETAHINRKKDFNRLFKQLSPTNNLLASCLFNILKEFIAKKTQEKSEEESNKHEFDRVSKLIDYDLLNLISKLAFLNTNMNSNWKLNHLRQFLASLVTFEGFPNLKLSLEIKDPAEADLFNLPKTSSSVEQSEPGQMKKGPSFSKNDSRFKPGVKTLTLTDSSMIVSLLDTMGKKPASSKDNDLTVEDLKINFNSQAVIGVCDSSSLLFGMEDMVTDSHQSESTGDKRNKQSLKLLHDCWSKLSKFDSNNSNSNNTSTGLKLNVANDESNSGTARFSQLIPNKQASCEPIRCAIKIVSSATIVLNCRELLILFINLYSILKEKQADKKSQQLSILELNCQTEYEFLQLLDILYYTENQCKYKFFIKNLIVFLSQEENDEENASKSKILNKISLMACDFMLPEFKLIKKISWSSDDKQEYDSGKLKNKINSETLLEENVNLSSNQLSKTLTDIEYGNNLTCKPNDIEKLSTSDSSTLLILFDTQANKKQNHQTQMTSTSSALISNVKPKKIKLNKFLNDTNFFNKTQPIQRNNKYSLGDNFESEKNSKLTSDIEDLSDTESVDSINENFDDKIFDLSKIKTKKRFQSSDKLDSKKEQTNNDDEEDKCDDDDNSSIDSSILDMSDYKSKKSAKNSGKKSSIIFQVISRRKDSSYDSNNDDYDDNQDNDDDDDDEDEDEDEDSNSSHSSNEDQDYDNESEKKSDNEDDDYSGDGWYNTNTATNYRENDDDKCRKSTFRLPLENIENVPFLAIKNQKMLKWKFTRREESDWTVDTCSFKIFSTFSKNFESCYYLLNEVIEQNRSIKNLALDDLWTYLIKICCVQSFTKRLKVLSLLIKIIQKVERNNEHKSCINLFELKPLKSLQYTLESTHKEDQNFSRALFELFFFAEKLAIKWSIQSEYAAKMRDREEFWEKISETSYFISLIMSSINLTDNLNQSKIKEIGKRKKSEDSLTEEIDKVGENDVDDDDDDKSDIDLEENMCHDSDDQEENW